MNFRLPLAFVFASAVAAPAAPIPRQSSMPLDHIVAHSIRPQLEYFFEKLLAEGKDVTVDGTAAFNGRDKFLPGKIAIGMTHLLLNTPRTDPQFAARCEGFRRIAAMTVDEDNHTWGIYFYMSALRRLQVAGLLDAAVDPETLAKLRAQLDWRTFVRQPDFTLIDLPTNYYGVAFSIARLRHLLGWEDDAAGAVLLEKMIGHYRTYSGEFGFSDETDGQGRFDRYSILLIGEICQRFIETGKEVTPQLKAWLRNAVDVTLLRLNLAGEGFLYGRSVGPYGDTAVLEILSAAATLGVLTPEETQMAYAFQVRAAARFAEFWHDSEMHSVNLWEKGRRTDAYRGKHRILGENMSLIHQHLYTAEQWRELGLAGRPPVSGEEFATWLRKLPRVTLTWFARGEYDRALLTFRDGLRFISLPLINGGPSQHMHNPYFPIPFSSGIQEGVADGEFPQLLPRFTLSDGTQLTATAYQRNISLAPSDERLVLTYEQKELDRLGAETPARDARVHVTTTYTFESGTITRTDRYTPVAPLEGVTIAMEFATDSTGPTAIEGNSVRFSDGVVTEFAAGGFDSVQAVAIGDDNETYRTATGQLRTLVRCESRIVTWREPLELSWKLRYR